MLSQWNMFFKIVILKVKITEIRFLLLKRYGTHIFLVFHLFKKHFMKTFIITIVTFYEIKCFNLENKHVYNFIRKNIFYIKVIESILIYLNFHWNIDKTSICYNSILMYSRQNWFFIPSFKYLRRFLLRKNIILLIAWKMYGK